MLKQSEIRVGSDDITIRSEVVIYNQNQLNLDVFRQVYQMPTQGNNENSGGTD